MFIDKEQEEKEAKEKDHYNNRFHQDNTYQFCRFCNAPRPFLYDRCELCKNN